MEGFLILRSAIEGARRALRSAADAINGALLGTEEEALMNRDPIMEVVAQNPREALRFIKLVMLFGASTGVLVSVPCIVYLSFYWGNCKCNKPLQWWVLIFSLLQISQVPVRYLFFFHLHTTPDDRTRIINTARILTGGRGWKCSKFVSILSYAWFILGVVWVFNAYDCSEAPGLWKLTVAAIVVSMLRLVTTFVCFWMSFPPNAGGGQQPETFRGAATAEQIARLPLFTYAEKKKHLTALFRKIDGTTAAGKGGIGGVAAGQRPFTTEEIAKGECGLSKEDCLVRNMPFSELSMPRESRSDGLTAAAAEAARKRAVDEQEKGNKLRPLSSLATTALSRARGLNIRSRKHGREAHFRQAASEEPRMESGGKRECDHRAAVPGRCSGSRRRSKSDRCSRVTYSTWGIALRAAGCELDSGRACTKQRQVDNCHSSQGHQDEGGFVRNAPQQERSHRLSGPSSDVSVATSQVMHGSDDIERFFVSGLRRWSCVSVVPSLPERVSEADVKYTVAGVAEEKAQVVVKRKEDCERADRARVAVARAEEKAACAVVTPYAAAPAAADAAAWIGPRETPEQHGGTKVGGELSSVQENCCICLSEFQDAEIVRELYCTHFFHQPCIDRWLLKNKQCPLCLRNIDADEIESSGPAPHAPGQGL